MATIYDQPLIELRTPDGKTVRVWVDGRVEGMPEGTVIVNHALPVFASLIANVTIAEHAMQRAANLMGASR